MKYDEETDTHYSNLLNFLGSNVYAKTNDNYILSLDVYTIYVMYSVPLHPANTVQSNNALTIAIQFDLRYLPQRLQLMGGEERRMRPAQSG